LRPAERRAEHLGAAAFLARTPGRARHPSIICAAFFRSVAAPFAKRPTAMTGMAETHLILAGFCLNLCVQTECRRPSV
jgi:hypothetical protein